MQTSLQPAVRRPAAGSGAGDRRTQPQRLFPAISNCWRAG